ncbi:MAG: SURF1 family protein [Alphaproteobacteria bacterium]|uniref:SURF1-like protein n=1 Tax=PS1 clade bacterium TaxID=2175152 RepID=A0A368DS67_9PROT|nr:hypothetical protein [Rhodobiaceae bacterium]OUT73511.1 MAG: hypothetical protein CBB85_05690 [Rhizobiales bacterium TMED25]RCL74123.1 MAG: SURF1 family protein [PS1 clade bacterium]|tara:strand:- start:125284 stop:126009 length:726 start_codon:yes stop_codon:yes gene_type:complete
MKSKIKIILVNTTVLISFIILVTLGTWQLDRKEQKEQLFEKIKRVNLVVEDFENIVINENNLNDWIYKKVSFKGNYRYEKELYVFTHLSDPRGDYGGAGYWIFNLFVSSKGSLIIINRGFVPQDMINEFKSKDSSEPVNNSQIGYIRSFEKRNIFTPDTDFNGKILYSILKEDIKKIFDINGIEPYFVDLISSNQLIPQSNETRLKFPDNHLSYAITWYGLATSLLFIYFYARIKRRKSNH